MSTNHSSPVTEPALKPCPFCGSKSVTISYFNQPATKLAASCQSCLAVGPVVDRYADPFAPWNTRTRPAQCVPKPVGFCDALEIVEQGFKTWREKPHNKKWVRHIDGTPIPNDVMVNIAEAISHSSLTSTVQQPVENKKGGAVWPTGTGNTPQDVQLTSLVTPPVFNAAQNSAESGRPTVTPDCAGGETVTRPDGETPK